MLIFFLFTGPLGRFRQIGQQNTAYAGASDMRDIAFSCISHEQSRTKSAFFQPMFRCLFFEMSSLSRKWLTLILCECVHKNKFDKALNARTEIRVGVFKSLSV